MERPLKRIYVTGICHDGTNVVETTEVLEVVRETKKYIYVSDPILKKEERISKEKLGFIRPCKSDEFPSVELYINADLPETVLTFSEGMMKSILCNEIQKRAAKAVKDVRKLKSWL